MRYKKLAPTLCLSLLFIAVLLSNSAVADMPSHSAGHEEMMKGDHGGPHGHGKGLWRHSHEFNPFRQILMYKSKLNLTPQQLAEIGDLRMEFKKQRIRNTADREIARLDFHKLLSAETLDEGRLQSAAKGIGDIISKQITATMDARIAAMKILTAEQRKKLAELDCDRQTGGM